MRFETCGVLMLAASLASCGSSGGAGDTPGSSPTTSVQVFAANDLGMHCVDGDFSVLSILPPFNVVHAQVVRRDADGRQPHWDEHLDAAVEEILSGDSPSSDDLLLSRLRLPQLDFDDARAGQRARIGAVLAQHAG